VTEAKSAPSNPLEEMPFSKVLLYIGIQAVAFTGIGLSLWLISDRLPSLFVTFRIEELGAGLALALALIGTSLVLARLFPSYIEWLVRSQARNYPFLKHGISIPAIIFISICAGVGEEALFRGGLQTWLGDYLPLPAALILASALFALIHFAQPFNSALIFVIGCLFGLVYWSTQSLLTVIIAHAVYDVYALWALQKAMHEFGVFDDAPTPDLPETAERETLETTKKTTGETP